MFVRGVLQSNFETLRYNTSRHFNSRGEYDYKVTHIRLNIQGIQLIHVYIQLHIYIWCFSAKFDVRTNTSSTAGDSRQFRSIDNITNRECSRITIPILKYACCIVRTSWAWDRGFWPEGSMPSITGGSSVSMVFLLFFFQQKKGFVFALVTNK